MRRDNTKFEVNHTSPPEMPVLKIDGIQNYKIVIATLFHHFEWGKYQNFYCAM